MYLPRITTQDVDWYFEKSNQDLKLFPSTSKAIKLGKGLEQSGHLQEIFYSGIDVCSPYCFVKTKCVHQTCLRDPPCDLWVIINKSSCSVHDAYCSCTGVITGTCKHVGALLYRLVSITEKGDNVAYISKKQAWGKNKRFHEPDFLTEIPRKRFSSSCEVENVEPKTGRLGFDPRAAKDRSETKWDWSKLEKITEGQCAVLKHVDSKLKRAYPVESSKNVVREETVQSRDVPKPLRSCFKHTPKFVYEFQKICRRISKKM